MARTEIKTEKVTRKVVTSIVKNEIALDETNASELLIALTTYRDTADTAKKKADEVKAELFSLMGYELRGGEWVGNAEIGTIAGNAVVKVATINATKFDKEGLIKENPKLGKIIEAYTKPAPYKSIKIVK